MLLVNADYYSELDLIGITVFFYSNFENRVLLKPVLGERGGGLAGVTYFCYWSLTDSTQPSLLFIQ